MAASGPATPLRQNAGVLLTDASGGGGGGGDQKGSAAQNETEGFGNKRTAGARLLSARGRPALAATGAGRREGMNGRGASGRIKCGGVQGEEQPKPDRIAESGRWGGGRRGRRKVSSVLYTKGGVFSRSQGGRRKGRRRSAALLLRALSRTVAAAAAFLPRRHAAATRHGSAGGAHAATGCLTSSSAARESMYASGWMLFSGLSSCSSVVTPAPA